MALSQQAYKKTPVSMQEKQLGNNWRVLIYKYIIGENITALLTFETTDLANRTVFVHQYTQSDTPLFKIRPDDIISDFQFPLAPGETDDSTTDEEEDAGVQNVGKTDLLPHR